MPRNTNHSLSPKAERCLLLDTTPQRNRRRGGWKVLARLFALSFLGALSYAGWWSQQISLWDDIRRPGPLIQATSRDNTQIYDRSGVLIGELFDQYQVHIPYKDLPKQLIAAIVAIEDRNFFQHRGIDPVAIGRAAWSSLRHQRYTQGASTITQQLVRHYLLSPERTLARKLREAALSLRLERELSKEQILELYCNQLFLGNGAYGVGAAALRYFGKALDQLAVHELAVLAGLFQSPSRFNPVKAPALAQRRQREVLRAMQQTGVLTQESAQQWAKQSIQYQDYKPVRLQAAPYFIDYIEAEASRILGDLPIQSSGLRIHTTLDQSMQSAATAAIQSNASHLQKVESRVYRRRVGDRAKSGMAIEAAMLTVDPRTGEILAMQGGRDYRVSQFNRTVSSLRSPGSAFKPAVFSLALNRSWNWSDMLLIAPIAIDTYRPKNYQQEFLSEATLLRSFYHSMNTPTIELANKIGMDALLEHARRLGVTSPLKREIGTALGSSEVTMLDLARMYSTFAAEGKLIQPIAINRITDRAGKVLYEAPTLEMRTSRPLSPQIAYLMTQGMKDVLRHGTGAGAASFARVAAGKTGTSDRSTDNWFCGYTPEMVTIVWVGTDDQAEILGKSTGGSLALPIWESFMNQALAIAPPSNFTEPPGIESAVIDPRFGHQSPSGIRMYFLQGRTPIKERSDLDVVRRDQGFRNIFGY